jgi:hypothetical protein
VEEGGLLVAKCSMFSRGKLKNPKNGFPENPCDEGGKTFSLKNIVLT